MCGILSYFFCFKLTIRARLVTTVTILNSPSRPGRFRSEVLVLNVQSVCLSSNLTKALAFAGARHMDRVCSRLPSSRAASRTQPQSLREAVWQAVGKVDFGNGCIDVHKVTMELAGMGPLR